MLRRWFVLASLFAVVLVMLAADASQGRERRFGRRGWRNDSNYYYGGYGMNYYDGSSGMLVAGTEMEVGQRQANYYDPAAPQTAAREMPVYLDVRVPGNAEIVIEGEKTTQTGPRRLFISPPLAPGKNYTYELKVKWMQDGKEVNQTRTVPVTAGRRVLVDLMRPAPNPQG